MYVLRFVCTLTCMLMLCAVPRQPGRLDAIQELLRHCNLSYAHPHLQAAALTLGIDTEELGDGSSSFNQLGGDSLAAIQFAREVDNLCGTTLPVSFVLDHSHSMKDIVEKVCLAAH